MAATTDRSSPLVLQVFGDLADDDVADLKHLLGTHHSEQHLVIDLSEVAVLSAAAVTALADAIRHANAARRTLALRVGPDSSGERALAGTDLPYESASRHSPQDRWRATAV